jgi:Zn-finger nucleic acid-binding protein
MQAGSLNCPHCGAAVMSDATQCPYCQSLLQTVACTRCMGMMFRGSKFCPHCGAAAAIGATSSPMGGAGAVDNCPRCTKPLVHVAVGAFDVQQCPTCGGIWMPVAVFDRICGDAEARSAAAALALPVAPPDPHPITYLKCPRCGQQMGRTNYAHRSGVITDVCRDHGVWLDRDEMRRIVEFIEAGGLVRARDLEKQRLDAARRALEFKQLTDSNKSGDGGDDDDDDRPW